MKIHHLSIEDSFRSLKSGPGGLTLAEAQRRLVEYGLNEIERIQTEPMPILLLKELVHFFAIILWIAAALAFVADYFDPRQGMTPLGLAIVGVILVNGLFSFWQAYRAERAILALQKLLPRTTKVMRQNKVHQVPAAELVPGDLVLLAAGDNVPADSRIVEAFGVRVNNATITGESLSQSRSSDPCKDVELLHARNVLLAGTSMVSGEAKAVVFATGTRSAYGRIAHLTQSVRESMSPLQKEIAHVSRLVAGLAVALGATFFLVGGLIGLTFWANFMFAIGVIVALVPEGLLPEVTLALALGSQRMAKRNALIRHLPAVETLGSTTVICTDKTGTLTQNRMAAKQLFLGGELTDAINTERLSKLKTFYNHFFQIAAYCHDLKETEAGKQEEFIGDPMEIALVRLSQGAVPAGLIGNRINEIPFDSERKRLSTVYRTVAGPVLYCKGAPEVVLAHCRRMEMQNGVFPLSLERKEQIRSAQDSMAEEGLRVLAFAYRELPVGYELATAEEDLVFAGLVGLEDPPRPEASKAVEQCAAAGVKIIMVTGDYPRTAKAIARQIGLVGSSDPVVITGEEMHHLSDTQLQLQLDSPEIIFARVAADQKMQIVKALKNKGDIVAVTGDGVNDAPALRAADIGVAMGLTGTDVARESADMILLDDNFASIVAAIEEGRAVFANIRKFLTYVLSSNIAELVPYLAFVIFKVPLPLTVIQILAVDLGTDILPALALGAEKPQPDIMERPPRARSEPLLNWPLILRSYGWLGLIEAVASMAAFFFVLNSAGWRLGQEMSTKDLMYLQATTATLTGIVFTQIMNVFLCRNDRQSIFRSDPFDNRFILFSVLTEVLLILAVVYTPVGNAIYGTAPISIATWLFLVPFAIGMLGLEELRKWLVRTRFRRFPAGRSGRLLASDTLKKSRYSAAQEPRIFDESSN